MTNSRADRLKWGGSGQGVKVQTKKYDIFLMMTAITAIFNGVFGRQCDEDKCVHLKTFMFDFLGAANFMAIFLSQFIKRGNFVLVLFWMV